MHSVPVRIPADIPPSLHPLIELFYSDALRIRGVAAETARTEISYLFRFLRHWGIPGSCEELFADISPESLSVFLAEYTADNSSSSLRWMQVLLRSFLRFACMRLFGDPVVSPKQA